jgi:hypothetical protein
LWCLCLSFQTLIAVAVPHNIKVFHLLKLTLNKWQIFNGCIKCFWWSYWQWLHHHTGDVILVILVFLASASRQVPMYIVCHLLTERMVQLDCCVPKML